MVTVLQSNWSIRPGPGCGSLLTVHCFYPSSLSLWSSTSLQGPILFNVSHLSILSMEIILLVLMLPSKSPILCYMGPCRLIHQLSSLTFPPGPPSVFCHVLLALLSSLPPQDFGPSSALCLEISSPVFLHSLFFVVN